MSRDSFDTDNNNYNYHYTTEQQGASNEELATQGPVSLDDDTRIAHTRKAESSSWSWSNRDNRVLYITIAVVVLLILGVYVGSVMRQEAPVPPMSLDEGAVTAQTLMQQGQTGDVLGISFANKFNPRIQIIRLVTGSRWIHVGILYRSPVAPHLLYVYEAYSYIGMRAKKNRPQRARNVRGVQLIPIEEWLQIHLRPNRLVGWNRLIDERHLDVARSADAHALPADMDKVSTTPFAKVRAHAASEHAHAHVQMAPSTMQPSRLQQLINQTIIADKMDELSKDDASTIMATRAGMVSVETIKALEDRARDHMQEPKTSVNMNILQWVTGRFRNRKVRDQWKKKQKPRQRRGQAPGGSISASASGHHHDTQELAAHATAASDKKTIFCTELATAALYAHGVLQPGVFHPEAKGSRHVAYTPYEVLAGLPLAGDSQRLRWQGIVCVVVPS